MWMKVDDQLHAHRKTRAVTKGVEGKARDAAPMGLWVLAGSYAALHGTDGWVPEDELDRWDDDWVALVDRLVRAGWWRAQKRNGEPGYLFKDWHDYNDPAGQASKSGTYGNHVRWHVNEAKVDPACEHCPKEPDNPDIGPESPPESGAIAPRSTPESRFASPPIALPEPEPLPEPDPNPGQASSDKSDHTPALPDRFEEFWDTYGNKVGRAKSEVAYRAALKKRGVTADLLVSAAAAYVLWCRETNTYQKNPLTWLHGEHWRDERPQVAAPLTRTQEHLALVQQLASEEQQPTIPQIGYQR